MVLSIGVGAASLWSRDSYSIGRYHFGVGPFNNSTKHARKERILTAAIDDGFNTAMFCHVLDWTYHLLLRRYKYQCSDCWSCYCRLPDKDSPRICDESVQPKVLKREAHATGSILAVGNSNLLESHMEWFGLAQLDAPQ